MISTAFKHLAHDRLFLTLALFWSLLLVAFFLLHNHTASLAPQGLAATAEQSVSDPALLLFVGAWLLGVAACGCCAWRLQGHSRDRERALAELQIYRSQLEDLVAARTDLLQESNRMLLEEIEERRSAEASLARSRDELEARVRERTAQLAASNARLEAEVLEHQGTALTLYETNEELVRINRDLESFAHTVGHDLKEPLLLIQALGERLRTRYGDGLSEHGKNYLQRIESTAARMQELIRGLLLFAEVTDREKRPVFSPVDLDETARGVLDDLDALVEQTGGSIRIGPLGCILGDGLQMRQLFQNLIGNGLKYRHPDLPPRLSVEAERGNSEAGPTLRLLFKDNGIGFDQKQSEKIFALFKRLHGRNEYSGSGVGLAICKRITDRHGGTISARSTPGQGALFTVELPDRPSVQPNRP